MKRHGNLFEQIASFRNLLEAERSALRGKRSRSDPVAFHFDLEPNLFDFYAKGVAQHSWHASSTIPKPQRGFTDIGRRHGIPNTETIVEPRHRAGVEPRWGSGPARVGGPRSQGALSRPWALMWNRFAFKNW